MTMTWYSAKLLFKTDKIEDSQPCMIEESIRLIQATDEEEAQARAEALGRAEEHSYANETGQLVYWRFIEVMEIQDLGEDEISDGIEVYSRLGYERE
jgi:hypothetical protein